MAARIQARFRSFSTRCSGRREKGENMRAKLTQLAMTAGVAAILGAGATPAFAQAADEEIVVTANRREARLQEVPVAVTAVSGEELAQSGVVDTEHLAQVAPSLFITSSQQVGLGAQIRMRGVGTATGNPALEGSVGYFIDGVYVNRSNTAFNDLLDVERVEVLRGPQGTLFGKNTSAGVINVFTRAPQFDFGGRASMSFTELGGIRVSGSLTGPIVDDQLAFSISALGNVRDGYMDDVVSGADYNDRDRWVARGQLLWQPVDNFSLRFTADTSARTEHSTVPSFTTVDPAAEALITSLGGVIPNNPPGGPDHFSVAVNAPFTADTEDTGYALIGDWETSFGDFRAILGYRDSQAEKDFDSDFTSLDVYRQTDDLRDEVSSAELQYTRTLGNVDLLLGAYAFNTDTVYRRSQLLGPDAGTYFDALFNTLTASVAARNLVTPSLWGQGLGMTLQDTQLDTEGWSIFTHNIWRVTPRLSLTLGLRYQEEDKEGGSTFTYNQAAVCTTTFVGAGSGTANAIIPLLRPSSFCASQTPNYFATYSDDQLTGTFVVAYDITDDIMTYTSYSTGFKSGGVNLDARAGASPAQTFLPESVESYEIGLKIGSLRQGHVLNLAAFHMNFEDFQLNSFSPTTAFVLTNEGSVTSYGVELEGALRITEGLWINGGVMWNEAQYGEDTANVGLATFQISNAPEWSGTLGINYERAVGDGGWSIFGRLDGRAQSDVRTASNLDVRSRQTGYGVLNTRFGLRNWGSGAELAVFGTNVTDTRYRTIAFGTTNGYMSYFGDPRVWGIELSQRW